jgi:hypothetical protein
MPMPQMQMSMNQMPMQQMPMHQMSMNQMPMHQMQQIAPMQSLGAMPTMDELSKMGVMPPSMNAIPPINTATINQLGGGGDDSESESIYINLNGGYRNENDKNNFFF